RRLLASATAQLPRYSPVLSMVNRFRIHEGTRMGVMREDRTISELEVQRIESGTEFHRDELKRFDLRKVHEKYLEMILDLGSQQTKKMYEDISQATEEVGNSIKVEGKLEPEHFLEMHRRIRMDFDPVSGEPKNMAYVTHPDTGKRMLELVEEWERDPEFKKEYTRIMETKKEEWRDRESRRKLVD
ncbi:MAG TPA: hypothetical protein VFR81_28255, partial [Longimicrobium sp.]|nr:hypothetical protein [Longimicrobium sp.]